MANCVFDKTGQKIIRHITDDQDSYDPWSWGMSWLFSISDHLFWVLDADVPVEWGYGPGAGYNEDDEYKTIILTKLEVAEIIYIGNVLNRYIALCDRKGQSY